MSLTPNEPQLPTPPDDDLEAIDDSFLEAIDWEGFERQAFAEAAALEQMEDFDLEGLGQAAEFDLDGPDFEEDDNTQGTK
jgi:hypothetical protein